MTNLFKSRWIGHYLLINTLSSSSKRGDPGFVPQSAPNVRAETVARGARTRTNFLWESALGHALIFCGSGFFDLPDISVTDPIFWHPS